MREAINTIIMKQSVISLQNSKFKSKIAFILIGGKRTMPKGFYNSVKSEI